MGVGIKKNVRSVKYMEDRYLFRAKRVDDGEWATGSLITCEDGTCKIATSCLESKADEPILCVLMMWTETPSANVPA